MRGKDVDLGLLILRIGVGLSLIYYGCQKMFGLFAGQGFAQSIDMFGKMGFPPLLGTLSIFAEFFGSLGLIVGLLTRVAAIGVAANMAVATWMMLKQPDIVANIFKYGQQADQRTVAFPLLLCLGALALLSTGGGRFSLDAKIFGKKAPRKG